jgi:hypothetical protein
MLGLSIWIKRGKTHELKENKPSYLKPYIQNASQQQTTTVPMHAAKGLEQPQQ